MGKSSSMDEKSADKTKKKESDDQKQRSSSVVSAISQMKDFTEILIQSSNENSSEPQNKQTVSSSNNEMVPMEIESPKDSDIQAFKDQDISDELVTLQKSKQEQIVTLTSQLQNVDSHVMELLQQGLNQ